MKQKTKLAIFPFDELDEVSESEFELSIPVRIIRNLVNTYIIKDEKLIHYAQLK